jgi:tRNA A37 threonylcarbamoyladenosine dehydratase
MAPLLPVIGQTKPQVSAVERFTETETSIRVHRRFDRAARLVGEPGLKRLMDARVIVFGMGGVGSFAAEALARNAVGKLVLVDFDDVCVTNSNRQLHALKGNIGKRKVDVMAERLRAVHPTGAVDAIPEFYSAETSETLLAGTVDFVVDAIDNLTAKAHLLATCKERGIPVVSSMGAAARLDPTRIRTADLSDTSIDPFARSVRKMLRDKHGLDCRAGEPVGITAVFSEEPPVAPEPISYDAETGFVCVCPSKDNGKHTCEKRSRIDGSAAFVTGTFGLVCASVVVRALTGK